MLGELGTRYSSVWEEYLYYVFSSFIVRMVGIFSVLVSTARLGGDIGFRVRELARNWRRGRPHEQSGGRSVSELFSLVANNLLTDVIVAAP